MFLKENTPEPTKKSKKAKKMEKPEKCPLCCENLEPDDLNFLPCPCGYKVCLFCWNRIRTSENDPKCPLCRRTYSENPAKFEPLSAEQLQKLKSKKKQEDVKKKQKLAEDRKQLADVRVVRKNLIFVNELPLNFSKDPKLYQRFINIFKQAGHVKKASILNSSKNYAGQKAPFARAYITYQKNEEALRALKLFENAEFEGRELKLSLGTTKYCSNYIKNVNCTNKECVYLHEQADTEASFTKEQIHVGKHIEYGQKLYEQYVQYVNNIHTKSISNNEDKKLIEHSHHVEDSEMSENSLCASPQQNSQHVQNERSSPTDSEGMKMFKQLQEIMKAANLTESPTSGNSSRDQCDVLQNLSRSQCDVLQKLINLNSSVNNSSNNSVDLGAKSEATEPSFEERFGVKRESLVPNGDLFHEERFPVEKESLLSRLNLINSHSESNLRSADNYRISFSKDMAIHNHARSEMQNSTNQKLEFKDDCGLDFDPVQMALGGLGELVISETQKARIDVHSMNSIPINAFKKSVFPSSSSSFKNSSSPSLPPRAPPVFSPNNFAQTPQQSTAFQTRSQNSPVVDFYNQASFRPAVQTTASSRSSVHTQAAIAPQRSQIPPFANALTIQLPRFSPGVSLSNNSMVNGYSPQQYMSQVSPQEAFLLSQQQQNQSFENFSQPQFSNFEQIPSPQVFSVSNLQSQSMRDFGRASSMNMSLGQRIRNEAAGRHQYQQQLQRLNNYCNSATSSESVLRPKGNAAAFP